MTGPCIYVPFAIGYDSSQINSSDFPSFFDGCGSSGPEFYAAIVGYSGASVARLSMVSRTNLVNNITNLSVSSFPTSQGAENVTFKMDVESFSYPLTMGLSLNQSDIHVYGIDPGLFEAPAGNPCSWGFSGNPPINLTLFQDLPSGYMQIDSPTLHLGTYSNGTLLISLLIQGPIAANTALYPTIYTQVPGKPQGYGGIATDFPVSIAGQLQTISGSCPLGS